MAIYNIFDYYEKESSARNFMRSQAAIDPSMIGHASRDDQMGETEQEGSSFLSACAARFFFFLLLVADLCWMAWNIVMLCGKGAITLLTLCQLPTLVRSFQKSWLGLKRSLVSGLALVVALFSPALGIMFSCMYFLMYDREGVDEIVPSSLRDQFKEVFPL